MRSSAAAETNGTSGPRLLLRALREAMAQSLGPQERLDRIVQQIADGMAAQVCSVYVLRSDDVLELFATQGLNAAAVHQSKLHVGQGLVGTIAAAQRPLNLPEARRHPAFAYLPETGEDAFTSFLGVPMIRAGRSLGVLVVQTQDMKTFDEEEIEALETAAMVLSDLVASGDFEGLSETGTELDQSRPVSLLGIRLAPGIGIGEVRLHEPRVVIENLFADDEDTERRRLGNAIHRMRRSVDDMLTRDELAGEGDHVDILQTYRMFAHDRGWVRRIEAAIAQGLTAEAAVEKVSQENRARLLGSADPHMRERLNDFDDLTRRLMKALMGGGPSVGAEKRDFVVVAHEMGAAELLDYDREHLMGVVLEEATPTSHVVIVARALDVAVVGKASGICARCESGHPIIVDGDGGMVHLRPPKNLRISYDERAANRAKRQAYFRDRRHEPATTLDGVEIDLLINAGLSMDLPQLETTGAKGVGLFRTELQYMVSETLPRLKALTQFYVSVFDAAGDRPVTFRTLDVGGDKVLPYLRNVQEDNPALGWRAIRLTIDRPALLRMQFRALIRAAGGRPLKIKLPMITMVSEISTARGMLDRELAIAETRGDALPSDIKLGAMIEVPNLLFQLDELMQYVDFVSVGSNDLFQFMVASDRTNSYLANRFDPLSRPFLRALRDIARAAERNDTPLQLCGELAGDPLSAMTLIAIGYRAISMPPSSIGPVKEMVRSVDLAKLAALVDEALDGEAGLETLGKHLEDIAVAHQVMLHRA